jgi:hypothetical protein
MLARVLDVPNDAKPTFDDPQVWNTAARAFELPSEAAQFPAATDDRRLPFRSRTA